MRSCQDFQEFDPTANTSYINRPDSHGDDQPILWRNNFPNEHPYTYANIMETGYWIQRQSEAGIERVSGRPYICKSMNMLSKLVDFNFVMAPGKPQDLGSPTNPLERLRTGVYNQNRTVVSSLDMAASAPFNGIYTGITGYLEEQIV